MTSTHFRWTMLLWTGLLLNSVNSILQKFYAPSALGIFFPSVSIALSGVYCWALLTKRVGPAGAYTWREQLAAFAIIGISIVLSCISLIAPRR